MSSSAPPIPPQAIRKFSVQEDAQPAPQLPRSLSTSRRGSYVNELKLSYRGRAIARRTLGICLLLITVFVWTGSNFLASTIFADHTYSKPYFVTYFDTSFFVLPLIPIVLKRFYNNWVQGRRLSVRAILYSSASSSGNSSPLREATREEAEAFLKPDDEDEDEDLGDQGVDAIVARKSASRVGKLGFRETARLSFEFCILWFVANYFALACLRYTTVASTTIITSTSSVWTLIFGIVVKVEKFSIRKTLAVLASMAGIALISKVDMSGDSDKHRGTFPHKSTGEIALGDIMAFGSAILYGIYVIIMKKRIGDETRVNMPLFFGFIGLINIVLLWPVFIILHLTGAETFELPPTKRVWIIIVTNATFSLISDLCWAYAMLLTSPLVTTVGLSLTIPLSLIGQMILDSQFSSLTYWFGAAIVFLSFIIVNQEDKGEQSLGSGDGRDDHGLLAGASLNG